MTQHPQQLPTDEAPASRSAQILPFEKPQTDLQRAVAARAQESLERSRVKPRPKPLKWILVCLVAVIPVVLLFGAVDALLRVFHQLNDTFLSEPAPPAPAAPQAAPEQSATPGVVILQAPKAPPPASERTTD